MSKELKFLVVIVLVLSIFFRFANLDQKVYSADEVRSILRLSGYTSQEFIEQVFTGDIVSVEDIQKYQKPTPDRNLTDAINALAGNPEHPPLYHLLTRFWMQLFNYPISARVASILLSLMVFPSLYWLCIELFQSPLVSWIAITLVAISPLQIQAAQNTTQYSLWTLAITLSSAALLKALRIGTKQSWLIYTATIVIGFYTHLFFTIVTFGHGIYVLIIERLRLTKTLVTYVFASLMGLLIFSPWIFVILTNLDKVEQNTGYYRQFNPTISKIIDRLLSNIANAFIDFHNTTRVEKYLDYLIFILVAYALYFLCRHTKTKTWLFLLTLILVTPIVHIVPNFISPSARPLQFRYYIPCFLGIQLTVSYLIASCINSTFLKIWQRYLWRLIFLSLLLVGVVSGVFISQINDWGIDDQKGTASSKNLYLAPIINQSEQPLVISEATHSFVLALTHLVEPKVSFQLFRRDDLQQREEKLDLSEATEKFSDVFILYADKEFLEFIDQNKNFQTEFISNNTNKKIGINKVIKK